MDLHLHHQKVQSMQLLLCSLSPESSDLVVYLGTIPGERMQHTTRLPTTKRDKKPVDFGGEHGFTTQTCSCPSFYQVFQLYCCVAPLVLLPPLGGACTSNSIHFLSCNVRGFLTFLLIYNTTFLLSFIDFGIFTIWVPGLLSHVGSSLTFCPGFTVQLHQILHKPLSSATNLHPLVSHCKCSENINGP